MRRLRLVASLLVLAVGACSSSDAPKTDSKRLPGLQGKLITVSDLPSGFTRVSVGERAPDATSSSYCSEIDQHRTDFPGERVAEAQFRRVKGTSTMLANEQLTRYATEADAARAFDNFEKALDSCGSVTKKNGENELAGSFEPTEFAKVGDETYATTFSATQMFEGDTASISGYFVTLRARRYVALFSLLSTVDTVDRRDAEAVVKKLVTRI